MVPEALAGKKTMCLAITEPYGGSDVAGVRTSAQKDDNGDYIVCGEKKFITGGACVCLCASLNVRVGTWYTCVCVCERE